MNNIKQTSSDISFAIEQYNKGKYSPEDADEAKRTLEAIVALRSHPKLMKEVENDK